MTQPDTDAIEEDNDRMVAEAKAKAAVRHCSFCEKSEHQVMMLIAGAKAFICDQCGQLVADIILKGLWDRATRLQQTIKDMENSGGTPAVAGVSDMEIPTL